MLAIFLGLGCFCCAVQAHRLQKANVDTEAQRQLNATSSIQSMHATAMFGQERSHMDAHSSFYPAASNPATALRPVAISSDTYDSQHSHRWRKQRLQLPAMSTNGGSVFDGMESPLDFDMQNEVAEQELLPPGAKPNESSLGVGADFTRRTLVSAVLGVPSSALAASNTYDFGYRFEKALDPKRNPGPATGEPVDTPAVDPAEAELLAELDDALASLQTLSMRMEQARWDEVREMLSNGPLVRFWNGPKQENPIRKLALLKDTYTLGLSDALLDLAQQVSGALNQVDNSMYDNSGLGSYTQEQLQVAIAGIQEAIKLGSGPRLR